MRCDTAQPCCGSSDSAFRIRRSSVPWGRSSRGLDTLSSRAESLSSRAERGICSSAGEVSSVVLRFYNKLSGAIVEVQDKLVKDERSVALFAQRRQPRFAGSEADRIAGSEATVSQGAQATASQRAKRPITSTVCSPRS